MQATSATAAAPLPAGQKASANKKAPRAFEDRGA
jgi:hypothetical protein